MPDPMNAPMILLPDGRTLPIRAAYAAAIADCAGAAEIVAAAAAAAAGSIDAARPIVDRQGDQGDPQLAPATAAFMEWASRYFASIPDMTTSALGGAIELYQRMNPGAPPVDADDVPQSTDAAVADFLAWAQQRGLDPAGMDEQTLDAAKAQCAAETGGNVEWSNELIAYDGAGRQYTPAEAATIAGMSTEELLGSRFSPTLMIPADDLDSLIVAAASRRSPYERLY